MTIIRHLNGTNWFWYGGDSKSAVAAACWQYPFITLQEGSTRQNWNAVGLATAGWTVVNLESNLAAHLAAVSTSPTYLFIDIGVNDISAATSQANFETAYASILDQLHTKWPTLSVLVAKIWRSGAFAAEIANINSWIDNVLATRSAWASVAFDEGDWLPAVVADALHPSVAGYFEMASQWNSVL